MIIRSFLVIAFTLITSVFAEDVERKSIDSFSVSFNKPKNWSVYREETHANWYQISMGLPEVWSKLEGANIENAVAVAAIRDSSITSLSDAVAIEFKRVADILVSSEEVPTESGKAFITITNIHGLLYKTLLTIDYKNKTTYKVSFTATEGTYDINLPLFKVFKNSVVILNSKL